MSVDVTTDKYQELEDMLGIEKNEAIFYESYNPLSLYCRLMELGIDKQDSLELSKYYENVFYGPLISMYKYMKHKELLGGKR